MGTYFDPARCPSCGAGLRSDQVSCTGCGLLVQGPIAVRLAAVLREADDLVAQLRQAPPPTGVPTSLPPPDVGIAAGVPAPGNPAAPPPLLEAPRAPALSVPAVLLGLGALCVLVAAGVFVAVTWGDLSVGARTLILLGVTAAVALAAVLVTRRGLTGSAESLWLVVAGMLALDAAGARSAGLLGLDRLSDAAFGSLAGASGLIVFAGIARWVGSTPARRLVGGQLVAAVGLLVLVAARASVWPVDAGWFGLAVLVPATALALASWWARLPVLAGSVAVVAVGGWALLEAAGVLRALEHPGLARLWGDGQGAQLLVASVVAAVAAAVLARPAAQAVAARIVAVPAAPGVVAAALAVGGVAALGWLPVAATGTTAGAVSVAIGAVVLAAAWRFPDEVGSPLATSTEPFLAGAAAVAVLASVVATVAACALGLVALVTVADAADPAWGADAGARLDPIPSGSLPAPWALPVLVVAVTVVVVLLRVRGPRLLVAPALAAAVTGAVLPLLYPAPLAVAVAAPLLLGALLVGASQLASPAAGETGLLLLLGSWAPALGSTGLTALVAVVLVIACVAVCVTAGTVRPVVSPVTGPVTLLAREVGGLVGVAAAGVAVFSLVSLTSTHLGWRAVAVAGLAAVALLAAQHPVVGGGPRGVRPGGEAGAALLAVVALALLVHAGALGLLALALTVVGASATAVALLVADRRLLAPVGGLLLASATWVRLVDSEIEVVEAYTLPSALVLVALGARWLHRDPAAVTAKALLPGLVLSILPSLLLALDDPLSLRGLLVGIAAAGLVLGGAWLHWGAPLVVGAAALAALAVRELWPVALAVPRWSLLALVGALLLAIGVTWEQRRRDLSTAARYVTALR